MAHHVYQTEALVLCNAPSGDSNRFLDFFSKDLGFVRAIAQSARRERSKMRYGLQEYTHAHVALVRGRLNWRVTGVQEIENFYYRGEDANVHILIAKITSLLRRLLHGEEKNESLYIAVLEFFQHITSNTIQKKYVTSIESLVVLRILFHLGYIGGYEDLLANNEFSEDLLEVVSKKQTTIIKAINSALQESQL
jgi:DNA repair protein RecO